VNEGLALTEPAKGKKKEHEIAAIKRLGGPALRFNAPKGTKVIHAYDPAIVDSEEWHKWKQGSGVYIVTCEKSNSAFVVLSLREWDASDTRNTGVTSDELVETSNGILLRRIGYTDPVHGTEYSFITTEMTLPPGIIAFIYKIRWNIEKVFDEKVIKKHASHIAAGANQARSECRLPNELVVKLSRVIKRSLQFIRWLQLELIMNSPWKPAIEKLRPLTMKYLV
jgi:hypothetical protein